MSAMRLNRIFAYNAYIYILHSHSDATHWFWQFDWYHVGFVWSQKLYLDLLASLVSKLSSISSSIFGQENIVLSYQLML